MPNKSHIELWLALRLVPRLAINKKLALVTEVGIERLFQSELSLTSYPLTSKQYAAITLPDWQKVSAVIASCEACGCEIITFDDPNYPQLLKEIHDPPLVLFVKGNIGILNHSQIAIIGSRSSTASGRDMAQSFAQQLVEKGIAITSGLAIGIDAHAHRGCLNAKGVTVAVVATGLDTVYPIRNKSLAKEICQSGAIVSEFPPGTPAKAGHFPRRNRIISGMSYGVLVVEAAMKSGSLITARMAMEQNREIFAVPHSIYNQQAKGCHWLIKQGAKLVEDAADIIEELEELAISRLYLNKEGSLSKLEEGELKENKKQDLCIDPLLASVGYEITPIDVVVSRSKLPTDIVLTRLTMLELGGLVTSVPGGYLRL